MKPEKQAASKSNRRGAWALWLGVILMFLMVITAWTILIKIAKANPVETIEIESVESD
ncbi:MAG: hypothetical protein ACPGSB_08895 [Opitutales bacterium]